jgi:hypothetical protein
MITLKRRARRALWRVRAAAPPSIARERASARRRARIACVQYSAAAARPVVRLGAIRRPVTARLLDPVTARLLDPVTARLLDPVTARLLDPVTARLLDPVTARLLDAVLKYLAEAVLGRGLVRAQLLDERGAPGGGGGVEVLEGERLGPKARADAQIGARDLAQVDARDLARPTVINRRVRPQVDARNHGRTRRLRAD